MLLSASLACACLGYSTPPREKLLIVAPAAFAAALEPFIAFKRTQPNIERCDILTLEGALQEGEARGDAAERLKRAIYTRWMDNTCDALLLVGDCTHMPFRYMMLDRGTKPAFDTAFYPSDMYYADLAREDRSFDDWNGERDSFHAEYFGEVHGETDKQGAINFDGISYLPEISVGRWPARTNEEVEIIAWKTTCAQRAWAESRETIPEVLFVAAGGWIDNRVAITKLARPSTVGDVAPWSAHLMSFFDAKSPATEHELFKALFSRVPRIVCHTGHGSPQGWDQCLDIRMLEFVLRNPSLPVLFSIGCSTAEVAPQPPYTAYLDVHGIEHKGTNAGEVFTAPPPPPHVLQTTEFDATSMSEEALRVRTGGAPCVIGCVTGAQPCAHTLLDGFVESARKNPQQSVGQWWKSALAHYHATERLSEIKSDEGWYPPSIFFQGMKFILLGDPTSRPLASEVRESKP